jgi:hypothetical protein
MFARLMGLKTISPGELHRLVQIPGHVTVIDVRRLQQCSCHVGGNQRLARREAAHRIWRVILGRVRASLISLLVLVLHTGPALAQWSGSSCGPEHC